VVQITSPQRPSACSNLSIRVFRNAWVSPCTRAGVPRSVAMKLTGHKRESVYNRYAIVAEQDLREGVAKLAALHTGGSRAVLPIDSRTITVRSGGR
jgi:hypothetical protein